MPSLEWIKITCDIDAKVQTRRLSRLLGIKVDEAVGKLFRFWVWCEHQSNNGRLDGMILADVDGMIGKKGFAAALIEVGWLQADDAGLSLPDFDKHMGAASRKRDAEAEKKRRQREFDGIEPGQPAPPFGTTAGNGSGQPRDKTGTETGQGRDREGDTTGTETGPQKEKEKEKEREEKETPNPPPDGGPGVDRPAAAKPKGTAKGTHAEPGPESVPLPPDLDTPHFREIWRKWIASRKARKKPLTVHAAEMQLAKLSPLGDATAAECVSHSIANDYLGLIFEKFPPGKPPGGPAPPFKSKLDRELDAIAEQLADALGPPQPPGDPP